MGRDVQSGICPCSYKVNSRLDSCDVGTKSVRADIGETSFAIAFVVSWLLVDKKFNGTEAHSHPV